MWGRRGADAAVVGAGYAWGRGGEWTMVYRALDHTIYLPTISNKPFQDTEKLDLLTSALI